MPIFDYHCHLPPDKVANNHQVWESYPNMASGRPLQMAGHAGGVKEHYITGPASDRGKFLAWAKVVPLTIENPLYHWTHLELKRVFGLSQSILSPETAENIYDTCTEMLQTNDLRVQNIISSFHVKAFCSTDDPADSLEHHRIMTGHDHFRMLPTFRPDKIMAVETGADFIAGISELSSVCGMEINSFPTLMEALEQRHSYFHEIGCRLSDHAFPGLPTGTADTKRSDAIFKKAIGTGGGNKTDKHMENETRRVRNHQNKQQKPASDISPDEAETLRRTLLVELGKMNRRRGWIMQLQMTSLANMGLLSCFVGMGVKVI